MTMMMITMNIIVTPRMMTLMLMTLMLMTPMMMTVTQSSRQTDSSYGGHPPPGVSLCRGGHTLTTVQCTDRFPPPGISSNLLPLHLTEVEVDQVDISGQVDQAKQHVVEQDPGQTLRLRLILCDIISETKINDY